MIHDEGYADVQAPDSEPMKHACLRAALMPSDGGTASFPDELEVVAQIIETYDSDSGLGAHLRARAAAIRAALAGITA